MKTPPIRLATAIFAGSLFSLGLVLSGMTLPTKVIAFLNVTDPSWDPSLAFVMGGALITFALFFSRTKRGRKTPLFDSTYHIPDRRDITPRLVIGSALFGIGWGLGGFCPGPALTSIGAGFLHTSDILIFVVSMLAGMGIFQLWDGRSKPATPDA